MRFPLNAPQHNYKSTSAAIITLFLVIYFLCFPSAEFGRCQSMVSMDGSRPMIESISYTRPSSYFRRFIFYQFFTLILSLRIRRDRIRMYTHISLVIIHIRRSDSEWGNKKKKKYPKHFRIGFVRFMSVLFRSVLLLYLSFIHIPNLLFHRSRTIASPCDRNILIRGLEIQINYIVI